MTDCLILPSRLDSSAAPALRADLLARRGAPLVMDASQVAVMGALAFEVVIAAGHQWAIDGQTLTIVSPSEPFLACAAVLGLDGQRPWSPPSAQEGAVAA